jgi:hypothetical protein
MTDYCTHEAWECVGGWHKCTDCRVGLGSRGNQIVPHNAYTCPVCAPTSSCIHSPDGLCGECNEYVESRMDAAVRRAQDYETKDSGKREEYDSGMVRDTQDGKPRFDLLFVKDMPYDQQPLTRWAALLERGATKYGEENWTLADSEAELRRFRASAARHFAQWIAGETDEDHMAAVMFNMTAVAYMEWKLGNAT